MKSRSTGENPQDTQGEVSHLKQEIKRLSSENKALTNDLKELHLKNQLYYQAVDNSPNPIYSIDSRGNILTWNSACKKVLLYDESIIGQHYSKLLAHQEQRDFVEQKLADVSHGHSLSNIDLSYCCKSGLIREMVSRIYALKDDQDQTYGFVLANTDVTERNKIHRELEDYRNRLEKLVSERTAKLSREIYDRQDAQAALKASNDILITILDNIEVEISVINLESSEVIFLNKQLRNKFDEKMRDNLTYLDLYHQKKGAVFFDLSKLWDENNKPTTGLSHVIYDTQCECWYLLHLQAIQWIDGKMVLLQMATDITERKRIDEELQRVEKLESIGMFAGGIAHDFNNLLTGILGNISLLKNQTPISDNNHKLLEIVENAITRASNLTQQLLTFSKGGELIRKPTSLADLLVESVDFSIRGSSLSHITQIEKDLKAADIDTGQIAQVIHNIAINAVQAMPKGGELKIFARNFTINKDTTYPLSPGEYIKIDLKDNGPGIDSDCISKIFDPYFTTKTKGNGLGLATSHTIIKKHGGHISVTSEFGKGTTFTIFLPVAESQQIIEEKSQLEPSPEGKGSILFMDDEKIIRDVASAILKKIGCDVTTANKGEEAIGLYQKSLTEKCPYDAVILDLTIRGGMGGLETFEQLLLLDPNVTAIVSSGYSNNPIMVNYDKFGFFDVITKPYRIEEIAKAIQRVSLRQKAPDKI